MDLDDFLVQLMCLLVRDGPKIKARDVSRENGSDSKTSCETFLHQEGSYILFGDGFLVSWVKLSRMEYQQRENNTYSFKTNGETP